MREHLVLYVNGRRHEVRGSDAFLTLSEYLRTRLRLTGTKIVCSEGDCGSCSVLVGRFYEGTPEGAYDDRLEYHVVDSCIQLMFQLDGTHIVTVEGLRRGDELSPVQSSMVELHGSQCGYCTPGFAVAMTGLLENKSQPTEEEWRCGLTGNLCRCTGYSSILAAAMQAAGANPEKIVALYPEFEMCQEFQPLARTAFHLRDGSREVYGPIDTHDAVSYLVANPAAKVVSGGTDVGVQLNKRMIAPEKFVSLNRIRNLQGVGIVYKDGKFDGSICCGAAATWSELLPPYFLAEFPSQLGEIVAVFGSPQIRNVGTIGGNLVNASPIADSIPFFMVMDAMLLIVGPERKSRVVNINDFYLGYRKTALQPAELLTGLTFFPPAANQQLSLYKISRRRDLDISTFTAAILLTIENETIVEARIALGAVGPTVIRVKQTEAFLKDKPFSESTMQAAGELAAQEVTPISDVRGSADFRWQLVRNVFLKFFHERRSVAA
ncbi:xanthine dehydrogenase small subunit [Anatilimnocola floriformis]|uniref:xanthine dehydrogenase small subunit n=1 Tax=Anatilimnocola floriformis TaxID=2948575 RepID=UPI0020C42433|nr:FAD binding domain-containing protein [Anatilimnocola floriformis]